MIDWYIILFLFAGLIIFNLDKIANKQAFYEFIMVRNGLGIKQGTTLLWMSLFMQTFLFIPIFTIFHFGLFFSVLFFLLFFLLIYVFLVNLTKQMRSQNIYEPVVINFYRAKLTPAAFRLIMLIILIANMDGFILQLTLADHVFSLNFSRSPLIFNVLFIAFCVMVAGLGGMPTIYRTGYTFLVIGGFIILFVPLFFYLKDGIHQIYQSYTFFNFHWNRPKFIFILSFLMASIGILATHSFLWQVVHSIRNNYRYSAIKLSIFCFSSIPLSVMLFIVYLLSKYHYRTFDMLSKNIFNLPLQSLNIMVVIVWLFSVANSVIFSIYSFTILIVSLFRNKDRTPKKLKNFYFFVICGTFAVSFLQYFLKNHLNMLFASYFLLYTAISFPFWSLLFSKKKHTIWFPISIFSIWFICLYIWLFENSLLAAATAGISSITLAVISNLVQFRK